MKIKQAFGLTVILYLIEVTLYAIFPYLFGNYDGFFEHYGDFPYDNLQGVSYLISRIIAYFIIFSIIKEKNINWKKEFNYKNYKIFIIFLLVLVVMGLQLVNHAVFQIDKIIGYFFLNNDTIYNFHFEGFNLEFVYRSIAVIALSPILEELFFRKILFQKLKEKYSLKTSLIISSICFALIHIDDPNNLIPTFFFGLISGLIYHKTNKIGYSILLHLFYNLYWFGMVTVGEQYINWLFNLEFNYIYWLLFLLGMILTFIGMKKITSANKELS
jgi:membrane protease YdiL (CAAX protease family)